MDYKRLIFTFSLAMLVMLGFNYFMNPKDKQADQSNTQANSQDASNITSDVVAITGGGRRSESQPEQNGLRVMPVLSEIQQEQPLVLGSLDEQKKYKFEIDFDRSTASVSSVRLSEHKYQVSDKEYGYPLLNSCKTVTGKRYDSFMVTGLKIDGYSRQVDLSGNCWELLEVGADTIRFKASIEKQELPFLDVIKVFTLSPDSYEITMDIELVNHSNEPVKIAFMGITGPVGVLREDPRSDRRNIFVSYTKNNYVIECEMANNHKVVENKGQFINTPENRYMEWFAQGNKFFTSVMRAIPEAEATVAGYVVNSVHARPGLINSGPEEQIGSDAVIVYTEIIPGVIEASASGRYQYQVFLGPVDKELFEQSPYAELSYSLTGQGASCSFCTFGWLNTILFKLMQGCYWVTGNYGISIIFLVFLVRLILHPITKKSQINMQQMSKMGPKMEEVKKKYANNPKEMQRQMALVYKEQGFSPIMGCLPMMLQMPIWIALYSSVDSNVGLRHQGLFPAWVPWLNDLSAPDRLISFATFGGGAIDIPLLGHVDAFNLLPILLCIAMFFQSKISMAQNVSATTTPEAQQQQKMMLYMMPIMMLVFFYTAPSGLNLYIMASTFAGLIEQKRIRKHLQEQEEIEQYGTVQTTSKLSAKLGPKKKKPKGPYKQY